MLENTEGAIKKGQSRETGNIGYTRRKTKTNKQKPHNTINYIVKIVSNAVIIDYNIHVYKTN